MSETGIESAIGLVNNIKASLDGYDGVIEASSVVDMLNDIEGELNQGVKTVTNTIEQVKTNSEAGLNYDPVARVFVRSQ